MVCPPPALPGATDDLLEVLLLHLDGCVLPNGDLVVVEPVTSRSVRGVFPSCGGWSDPHRLSRLAWLSRETLWRRGHCLIGIPSFVWVRRVREANPSRCLPEVLGMLHNGGYGGAVGRSSDALFGRRGGEAARSSFGL